MATKIYTGQVGGLAFFLSLGALVFLAFSHTITLARPWDDAALEQAVYCITGGTLGLLVGGLFARGKFAVLVHEFKHSLISGLVGNKARSMKVSRDSGHFEYSFTKDTAHFNAFIQLAPYWVPLWTGIVGFALLLLQTEERRWRLIAIGLAYGIDMVQNCTDFGPHQTDLTRIRGGVVVASFYVIVLNYVIFTLLSAWALGGFANLVLLGKGSATILGMVAGRVFQVGG